MNPIECPYEGDVLTAVSTKRWPNRVDAELRDHVSRCAVCADVVAVTMAFEEELETMPANVPPQVPESGLVWWRAQMRARQDATRLAVRPITVAQAVAFAAAVGVTGAVFGATASWFQRGLHWLGGVAGSVFTVQMPDVRPWFTALMTDHAWLVSTGVLACLLFPLAIYLLVKLSERPA